MKDVKAVLIDAGNTLVWPGHASVVELVRRRGVTAVLVDPLGGWTELDCDRVAALHELPAWLDRAA